MCVDEVSGAREKCVCGAYGEVHDTERKERRGENVSRPRISVFLARMLAPFDVFLFFCSFLLVRYVRIRGHHVIELREALGREGEGERERGRRRGGEEAEEGVGFGALGY